MAVVCATCDTNAHSGLRVGCGVGHLDCEVLGQAVPHRGVRGGLQAGVADGHAEARHVEDGHEALDAAHHDLLGRYEPLQGPARHVVQEAGERREGHGDLGVEVAVDLLRAPLQVEHRRVGDLHGVVDGRVKMEMRCADWSFAVQT